MATSSEVRASACNAGDLGSIPGSGRSPGEGNGNPLQYSCLENPTDRGVWWATYSPWGCKLTQNTTCYLTTNQKNVYELVRQPTTFTPNVALKIPSLKAIGEFGPFEHEVPIPHV